MKPETSLRGAGSIALLLTLAILGGACIPGDAAGPSTVDARPVPSGPNVVLILVDTLRKDHLRLYGYSRRTSETIDRLGESGWTFDNHIAHGSQTVPSTLSMMLSRYPADHGFVHRFHGQFAKNPPKYPDDFRFLAEVFHDAGYATGGFVANPFLGAENGFDQGFDAFELFRGRGAKLTRRAANWLRSQQGSARPFFLYLHYIDVHHPYEHPRAYERRFPLPEGGRLVHKTGPVDDIRPVDLEYSRTLYDAGIVYVDDQIAAVLEELERIGKRKETVVAVTSDHGEEFLEHGGMGHGTSTYGELVRIPLVLHYPPRLEPGRRVSHLTQHLDLAPSLLRLAGLEAPSEFRGSGLFHAAELVYTEGSAWRAVYAEGKKLVLNRETGEQALYAASDELDQEPLDDPAAAARLRERLETYLSLEDGTPGVELAPGPEWSEEKLQELKALGYLN